MFEIILTLVTSLFIIIPFNLFPDILFDSIIVLLHFPLKFIPYLPLLNTFIFSKFNPIVIFLIIILLALSLIVIPLSKFPDIVRIIFIKIPFLPFGKDVDPFVLAPIMHGSILIFLASPAVTIPFFKLPEITEVLILLFPPVELI